MFPTLNGKNLLDCYEKDLKILIENPDYRENEFLDYKVIFSFLEAPKGSEQREKCLSEFRSDVCSFANAEGGYLLYGISDDKGMAKELIGIDIPNSDTDRFELDRKNNLAGIFPKIPPLKFHFVPLSNGKYIVILFVAHDSFTPYIHLAKQSDYKIYKRVGNNKSYVSYVELKNMFNQSLALDKEILNYRNERVSFYQSQEDTEDFRYTKFMLLHIIPDTFFDSTHNKYMLALEKKQKVDLFSIFKEYVNNTLSIPNVDGLRFIDGYQAAECLLNNNGIAECFYPLNDCLNNGDPQYPNGFFASTYVWDKIQLTIENYIEKASYIVDTQRLFVCISIIGCKNVVTEHKSGTYHVGKIDRNTVLCHPVAFENIFDPLTNQVDIRHLKIEYCLALGIKTSDTLNSLLEEMYPHA